MLFGSASGMITIQGSQALNTARNITRALTDMGRVKPNVSMKSTINDLRQAGREAATAGSRTQGLGRHIRALAGTRVSGVLTPLEQEARSAEAAVDDLAQSVDQMALGLILAGGASAALGKPLMAATIGSIKNAASLEQAIQNINAALGGLDPSTLADLSDHMIQIGIDSEYSAQEVAGVAEALAKAGYDTEEIMGGMTKAVIDLASATGTNLEPATRGIIQALSIWAPGMVDASIAMTDAARAADILTIAANESQADVEEIIQGMRALGPVAGQLGIGFDEAAAAIAIFTNYGMKGADAGLSLARGLENLSTPTSEAAARMEELGIAAFDAQGDFVGFPSLFRQLSTAMKDMDDQTKLATLSMIFGQEAADVMALAIASGADPLEAMIALMDEQGVAANQAALRMDTLSGAWQQFTEGIQSASGAMMRGFLEPLKNIFEFLSDMLGRVAALPQPILNLMGALLALSSTLLMVNAGVLIGRGVWARWGDELLNGERAARAMAGSVGGLRTAFVALWRSFGVGVFSLIPSLSTVLFYFTGLAAIILGMGAVIGAFRADFLGIRTAFEGVQNFIDNFREGWNKFKDEVSSAAGAIDDVKEAARTVTDPIEHAKNTLDSIASSMNNVSDAAESITLGIGRVSLFFMALAYAIRLINDGDIPGWARDLADALEDVAPIAQQVVDILQAASNVDITNLEDIKRAIEDLPGPIQNLVRGVSGIITSFSVLGRALSRGGFRSFIVALPYELTLMGRAFGDVFRGISDVIRATTGSLGRIGDLMRPVANMFDELGDAAQSLGRGLSWMMLGEWELAMSDLRNALTSLGRGLGDLGDVFEVVSGWMEELGEQFPQIGKVADELTNVFDNLSDVFGEFGSALQNFADGNYSEAFRDLGQAVASLISAGIDYAQALFWGLVAAIEALDWTSIIQGIRDFADGMREVPYIGWLLEVVLDGIASGIDWVRSAIIFAKDHWDDMKDAFEEISDVAVTLWEGLSDLYDTLQDLPQPLKDIAKAARDAYVAMLILQGLMMVGGMGRGGGMLGGLLGGLMSIAFFPLRLLTAPLRGLLRMMGLLLTPVTAVIGAFGGLGGVVAFLLNPLRAFTTIVGALMAGLGAILSPVGLLVIGLGALAAGLIHAYSTSEDFREIVNGLIDTVLEFGGDALQWAIDAGRRFGDAYDFARRTGADPFSAALIGLVGIFPRLGGFITDVLFGVNDLKRAWDLFVAGDYDGALAALGDAANHVWGAISGIDWNGLWGSVVEWFGTVDWAALWDGIQTGFWAVFNAIPWDAIGNIIARAFNAIPWDTIWQGLKDSARRLFEWFQGLDWDGITAKLREMGGPLEGLANIIDTVRFAWDLLTTAIDGAQTAWNWVKNNVPGIKDDMEDLEDTMQDVAVTALVLVAAAALLGLTFGGLGGAWKGAALALSLLLSPFKLLGNVIKTFPQIPSGLKKLKDYFPASLAARLPLIAVGIGIVGASIDGWKNYTGPVGEIHQLIDDIGTVIDQIRNGEPVDWGILLAHLSLKPIVDGIIKDLNRLKNFVQTMFGGEGHTGPVNVDTGMTADAQEVAESELVIKYNLIMELENADQQRDQMRQLINDVVKQTQDAMGTPVLQIPFLGNAQFTSAEEAYQATLTLIPNLSREQWNDAMPDEWDVQINPKIDSGAVKAAFQSAFGSVGDSVSKGIGAALGGLGASLPTISPEADMSGFASPDPNTIAGIRLYNSLIAGLAPATQQAIAPQQLYQSILERIAIQQALANTQMNQTPFAQLASGWTKVQQPLPNLISNVKGVGTTFAQTAGVAIGQSQAMNVGVVSAQSGMAGTVISNVGRMAAGALGGFTSMQSGGTEQASTLAGNALGSSLSMSSGVIGSVLGMAGTALTGFGSMLSGGSSEASRLDKNASGSAKGMGSTVGSAISSMASLAMGRFGSMQSTGTSESSRMKGNVSNNSSSMAQAVGNAMQQVVRNVSSGMSDASRAISREAGNWGSYIRSAGGSAAGAATGVGVAIGQGLVNGMASMRGAVAATAASLAAAATVAIALAAATRSPSKITTDIGKDIARGLPVGMTHRDSIHRVTQGAKDIVGRLMAGIQAAPQLTWADILGTRTSLGGFGLFPALANGVHYSGLMQQRYTPPTPGSSMQHKGTYAGESMAYQRPPTQTNITNIYALRAEELTELIEKSQRGADHADAWEQPQALSQYVRVARS